MKGLMLLTEFHESGVRSHEFMEIEQGIAAMAFHYHATIPESLMSMLLGCGLLVLSVFRRE